MKAANVKLNIEWPLFAEAISFYETRGFKLIDVPWAIQEEAYSITSPPDAIKSNYFDGFLVASAEQSFIQMMLNKELRSGSYMALTPCFRHEKNQDDLHLPYFMKLELITIGKPDFEDMISDSWRLFKQLIKSKNSQAKLKLVSTDDPKAYLTWDIIEETTGIELGSYGMRDIFEKRLSWTFGTGLALPRFSQMIEKVKATVS